MEQKNSCKTAEEPVHQVGLRLLQQTITQCVAESKKKLFSPVLKARHSKLRCAQGRAPSVASVRKPFLSSSNFWYCQQSLVFLGLWEHSSIHEAASFLCLLIVFPLCMSVSEFQSPLFIRALVILNHDLMISILTLITSVKEKYI